MVFDLKTIQPLSLSSLENEERIDVIGHVEQSGQHYIFVQNTEDEYRLTVYNTEDVELPEHHELFNPGVIRIYFAQSGKNKHRIERAWRICGLRYPA
jgi:hypothetical protein